jgi:hypothetical protein
MFFTSMSTLWRISNSFTVWGRGDLADCDGNRAVDAAGEQDEDPVGQIG